ncbi:hypothetical protein GPECTOR_6g575 [Gonium pectorale]|uniref:Uncharacterized protein n=1 Tax=Gonium pectorale TaxID=33097 RepID=A0A150GVE2_GONPE|nr:hypothetical protein GPECTOR_6g575 [Gonium pectorale]|eukprot:KXZ53658.1 hypothetical protein GPECTOR_6g575 [Gonium pectorale]
MSRNCTAVEQRCERAGRSSLRIGINALALSPLAPHLFATGGGDPFARLYDLRMLRGEKAACQAGSSSSRARPAWVSCFAPHHLCTPSALAGSGAGGFSTLGRARHLTGLTFAAGGAQLVLSYSGEASSAELPGPALPLVAGGQNGSAVTGQLQAGRPQQQHGSYGAASASPAGSEESGAARSPLQRGPASAVPAEETVPIINSALAGRVGCIVDSNKSPAGTTERAAGDRGYIRCFDGHKNIMTMKEVAWMGGSSCGPSYVISGSDDGHVFVWDYGTGDIMRVLGSSSDHLIPSCLAVHPCEPMLATCGNGTVVKMWGPGGSVGCGRSSAPGELDDGSDDEAVPGAASSELSSEDVQLLVQANRADLRRRQAEAVVRGRPTVSPGWATFAAAIRERSNDVAAAVLGAARAEVAAASVGPRVGPHDRQADDGRAARGRQTVRLETALGRERRRSGSPEDTIPAFGSNSPFRARLPRGPGEEDDGGIEGGGGGRACSLM